MENNLGQFVQSQGNRSGNGVTLIEYIYVLKLYKINGNSNGIFSWTKITPTSVFFVVESVTKYENMMMQLIQQQFQHSHKHEIKH